MIPAPLRYHRASSVEDALQALAEPDATAIAGGQSLVSVLKLRLARPTLVVDIGRLELRGIELDAAEVRIGALTTWDDLLREPALRQPGLAAIAECADGIGDLQVRNRGTVGGGLAHADPASDFPAVALALHARARLSSMNGERVLDVQGLVLGPFLTAIAPDELLTELILTLPPAGSGSAYECVEHPASGFALAGAAALVGPDGEQSVAVTGVGARPFALSKNGEPEAALEGAEIYGDDFASADYRRGLAAVTARRAIERARRRAEEGT